MIRALTLTLVLAVGGAGLAAEAAPAAKKRCPKGTKLVKKKCKRSPRKPLTNTGVSAVSGSFKGSSISIAPNAKTKTAAVKVTISCTSAEGVAVSQSNGGAGSTVKISAVINLQQQFDGSVIDPDTSASVSWQLTGLWKTATRFEGIFSGSANAPGRGSPGPGCSVAPMNVVLR